MEDHQRKLDSYLKGLSLTKKEGSAHHREAGAGAPRRLSSKEKHMTKAGTRTNTLCATNVRRANSKARNTKSTSKSDVKLSNIAERLPEEVLLRIFGLLRPCDLLNCSCVCHRWMKLAGDNLLWQPLYERFKFPHPGEPDSVYTTHAGILWKDAFMQRCLQRRNVRLKHVLKKKDPYTGLPANTDSILKKLGTSWHVILRDRQDNIHSFSNSDVFFFNTSVTVRWYAAQFIPPGAIQEFDFKAEASVLFEKDGTPVKDSPQKSSLLLSVPWKDPHDKAAMYSEDDTLNLRIIHPGVIVATWKDGGGLAFVSLSLHKWGVAERCLLGNSHCAYQPAITKPPADDVDPQYGLHGYSCNIELRQQRALCWGERFTKIHCPKENIDNHHATFTLIHTDDKTEHTALSKKLCLPWKTDLFKGIYRDLCILDVTLLDEFSQPFWCVSTPVSVKRDENCELSLVYHGEQFSIHYSDCKGSIDVTIIRDEDESKHLVTSLVLSVKMAAINSWFCTSYS